MAMRGLAFVMLAAVALGGCVQDVATGTLDPSTDASWKQRDKDLMSNLPYNQSAVSETYRRHIGAAYAERWSSSPIRRHCQAFFPVPLS